MHQNIFKAKVFQFEYSFVLSLGKLLVNAGSSTVPHSFTNADSEHFGVRNLS